MGKFTITHEVACNVESFWNHFLDKDLTTKFYLEVLGYPEYQVLEQSENDTEILRKAIQKPKANMPGPVAKLMGTGFSYAEEGHFNKASQIWRWRLQPSTLADKLRIEGTLRVTSLGDTRMRYSTEIEIEAKVFGIGGLIESVFEKNMREESDAYAVFLNKSL